MAVEEDTVEVLVFSGAAVVLLSVVLALFGGVVTEAVINMNINSCNVCSDLCTVFKCLPSFTCAG